MSERILVFIPCYNCEAQIGRVLSQFTAEVGQWFEELLVLDNGSQDGTLETAIASQKNVYVNKLTIARNRANYNLGGSHKAAFAYAVAHNYSHVVVLHGDDQGDIRDLLPILKQGLHRKHDACLGARFLPQSRLLGYSRFRIFGNHIFNHLFSIASLSSVADLGSGLNIFGLSIIADPGVLKYSDDLRFNIYLLLSAIDQKRNIEFFPISWREDDQISNVKLQSQALKTLEILYDYVLRPSYFRSNDFRTYAHTSYEFDVVFSAH